MKKFVFPVAAIVLAMFSACGGNKNTDVNAEPVASEAQAPVEAEPQALVKAEDPDPELGPVWTMMGGCYFFYGDGKMASVSIALSDDEPTLFNYDGDEYPAVINKTTGQILAYDESQTLVFCGYLYYGGNALGGNFRGERIFMEGPGD